MALTLITASTAPLPGQTPQSQLYSISAPGAGTELSFAVPAGQIWKITSLVAILTTTLAGGSRAPNLTYNKNSSVFFLLAPAATLSAGQAGAIDWAVGLPYGGTFAAQSVPLPDTVLFPGTLITTETSNLQSGDTYTSIVVAATVYT